LKPSKLPEAHEIKSFKDVVTMYTTKVADNGVTLRPPDFDPEAADGESDPTRPAFYNFQKYHPMYNSHNIKKFEEL
jgi:hypothetical protein